MKIILYLLGFLPSIIWLLFYLRKDSHPEPNKMVLKVFFLGMLSGFFAIVLEKGFQKGQDIFMASVSSVSILNIFVGGALIEELIKYGASKIGTHRNIELDEPVDFIFYMIIAGLGFAALENILILTNYHPVLTASKAIEVMFWRFVSATFLHALCSGIFGFFIALSFFQMKKRKLYFITGLLISFILHGLYNWSIINIEGMAKFVLPLIILGALSIFLSFGIRKLKRLKSVCNLK